jgi:hypothetical protein
VNGVIALLGRLSCIAFSVRQVKIVEEDKLVIGHAESSFTLLERSQDFTRALNDVFSLWLNRQKHLLFEVRDVGPLNIQLGDR